MVDWKFIYFVATLLFMFAGFIPYLVDTLRRKTKPHVYTWLIWFLTQVTATIGLWLGNGGLGAISLTVSTILVFVILILSFWYGTKNIKRIDTIIFVTAILFMFIWWNIQTLILAVVMVAIIDFMGYLPSFRKTYEEPWTETLSAYLIYAFANIFNILSLSEFTAVTMTYLIVIAGANMAMVLIMILRRWQIKIAP